MRQMKRFVLSAALLGFLVPVAFVLWWVFRDFSGVRVPNPLINWIERLRAYVWPSTIIFMAYPNPSLAEWLTVVAIAAAINVVLYSVFGLVAWWFWNLGKHQSE